VKSKTQNQKDEMLTVPVTNNENFEITKVQGVIIAMNLCTK